jgi:type I restriction-modification system DNA methylase subunit
MPERKTKQTREKNANQGRAAASPNGTPLGFEAKLWQAADKLRNNMDAAEYKHVVLGLIFLKYIADAFEERHAALEADKKSGAEPIPCSSRQNFCRITGRRMRTELRRREPSED